MAPYYTSLNPLTWKTGKEGGYCEASYSVSTFQDAATANWGSDWAMMSRSFFINQFAPNITYGWVSDYKGTGVSGYLIEGKNTYSGKTVFFPAAAHFNNTEKKDTNHGNYWLSTDQHFWGFDATQTGAFNVGDPWDGRSIRAM